MKWGKSKNIETHLVPELGPRVSASALGPSPGTKWFSIFLIFPFHETTQGFKFSGKNIREATKHFQKMNETRTKKTLIPALILPYGLTIA